jgi:hypothetical protein
MIRNQPVLEQNPERQAQNRWRAMRHDNYGRMIASGFYDGVSSSLCSRDAAIPAHAELCNTLKINA